jgi:hypothetical protein
MSTDQTKKEILAHIVEFVGQQITSGSSQCELIAQNEVMILQLNQRFGADRVREVLRGMVGEAKALASLFN